jgi:hypothetical protein
MSRSDDKNEEREERIKQLMERAQKHLPPKNTAAARAKPKTTKKPRKPK